MNKKTQAKLTLFMLTALTCSTICWAFFLIVYVGYTLKDDIFNLYLYITTILSVIIGLVVVIKRNQDINEYYTKNK